MPAVSTAVRTDLDAAAAVAAMHAPAAAPMLPSSAVLIVDETLAVVGADAAGRALLGAGLGVGIVLGRLTTGHAAFDLTLRSVIAKGEAVRDLALPVRDGRAPRLSLALAAVTAFAPEAAGSAGRPAQAVLMLQMAVDRAEESIAAIRKACGLTGAETETLRLIFKGLSTVEAASVLGIAKSTARTHLQRVFAKTETSRQSELVHFVGTWGQH